MVNPLLEKIKKNSTIKQTAVINESKVFGKKTQVETDVPIINLALSGEFDGGLSPGILQIAGQSKHFKSGFAMLIASSFLRKYADGIVLFYDSEFGTPESYFTNFDVDVNRVVHTPITNIEELKFDIVNQLKNLVKEDNILILIDSLGNVASSKEVEDAEDKKSVADMSRAKALKSLFRIITPHLNLKNIPMVVINHTYKEIGLYPKYIVSGGTGAYYSSNDIWIIGRQQDKDGKELQGFNFIINIDKSRFVQEKSKFPVSVSFGGGINKWSGLFDLALEGGFITNPKQGWYNYAPYGEKMMRLSELENDPKLWNTLLKDESFKTFGRHKFKLNTPTALYSEFEKNNGSESDEPNE